MSKPTICAKCKFKVDPRYEQPSPFGLDKLEDKFIIFRGHQRFLLEWDMCPYCIVYASEYIDFVSGETKDTIIKFGKCKDLNTDGNCQYFKDK